MAGLPSPARPAPGVAPALPEVDEPPSSLGEIYVALEHALRDSVPWWDHLGDADFFSPVGEHWSAADHVRHLTRSVRRVERAMRLPSWALHLLFGRATRPSRGYVRVREDYRAVLAAGGKAGAYAPRPLDPRRHTPAWRRRIMRHHCAAVGALQERLLRWNEADLDSTRLPHPLMGRMTVREVLHFTVYHNLHHVHAAARRRAGSIAPPTGR